MLILLFFAFLLMLWLDFPALLRKKQWRHLAVFLVLWLLGFVMSFLLSIGVKLPSPVKGIEYVIKFFLPL